ncbi:hypothetical protein TKV_c22560 [Thermoanaerobacter kivui]|uniref:Uncharacterized protein n=1 Tax=Thermoanaerobacter kivui TaxID=2325 RepID=A0A097AUA8_THEKI|nr:hypothetical protein [Thermoanaerobacter kivui]AIS53385.1 hypothetical protein TKV_c22560 [Thermoanaerobacter kivui]
MVKKSLNIKKLILLFAIALFLSISTLSPASATDLKISNLNNKKLMVNSPQEYESYLIQKANNSNSEEKNAIINALYKYKSLTKDKQEKFIEIINNKELMRDVFKALGDSEKETFLAGDIVVDNSIDKLLDKRDYTISSSSIELTTATYKRWVEVFGITVFETTSWVKYEHDNYSILSIVGYDHVVSRNLLAPAWSYSWSGKTAWIFGDKAYSTADLTMIDLGIPIQTVQVGVWGDIYNNAGGWVNKL